jgi:hypothetical protein
VDGLNPRERRSLSSANLPSAIGLATAGRDGTRYVSNYVLIPANVSTRVRTAHKAGQGARACPQESIAGENSPSHQESGKRSRNGLRVRDADFWSGNTFGLHLSSTGKWTWYDFAEMALTRTFVSFGSTDVGRYRLMCAWKAQWSRRNRRSHSIRAYLLCRGMSPLSGMQMILCGCDMTVTRMSR